MRRTLIGLLVMLSWNTPRAQVAPEGQALIDLTGIYSDTGMTISATGSAPRENVSFGALICGMFDPSDMKTAVKIHDTVRITQHGDLMVEFAVFGPESELVRRKGAPGIRGTWTKADGLIVDAEKLVFRQDRYSREPLNVVLTLSMGIERRLVVKAEIIYRERTLLGRSVSRRSEGTYMFLRLDTSPAEGVD